MAQVHVNMPSTCTAQRWRDEGVCQVAITEPSTQTSLQVDARMCVCVRV
jgi:hypothetical protein